MISILFGYIILFMAINYGRKEDSRIPLFSWKWLLIILMVILGSHFISNGHRERESKQRIHIEQSYEANKFNKV